MKTPNTHIKAYKSAYNREWYKANKMYKDTYKRIWSKVRVAETPEQAERFRIANSVLVHDRKDRVRRGAWIDQRTGGIYTGISI